MRIYLICPVRNANPDVAEECSAYAANLEMRGHMVHYPPRDVDQSCPTGKAICESHRAAMIDADEVHVLWDVDSKGSHFDLGMAYALGKPIVAIKCFVPDMPGKSYWKVMCESGSHK